MDKTFGSTVTVKKILRRRCRYEEKQRDLMKFWEEKPITARSGLLVGWRTLSNGISKYDHEDGYTYTPNNHFRAALVVFSERENPVYVPVSELQ